ncbi:MAG TPA: class I SAM-dependent methyltransferase [Flavipsychrobacter sp.]|nr:class I SAM-dependent methyltransferase [Flavipsychrobacter sp.]
MEKANEYLEINKKLWNEKTKYHKGSAFYDLQGFIEGKSSLNSIEKSLLGDVSGKSILHLQCHFGLDSLSLAREGANVTGVDISDEAIGIARQLATDLHLGAEFICCNVYDLPQFLNRQFDIIYTSYGVLGWLPDMNEWAQLISRYLKKNGNFVLVEFHPVVWMFDYDFASVAYSYFNKETIEEEETGTYADRNAPVKLKSISWNHNIAEVLQSLLNNGLRINIFQEFDYSPYNCFNNLVEVVPGKYQIKGVEEKLPMVYAIKAIK